MTRSIVRFGIPFIGCAIVSVAAMAACSSDTKSSGGGAGGATATGGASGNTGGSTAASGGGGSAATGGAAGDVYTCFAKPPADPGGTGVADAACCTNLGHCVTAASITDPKLAAAYGHDSCSASPDLRCAPTTASLNLAASDAGAAVGVFETCRFKAGPDASPSLDLEGRCIPKCFLAGNKMAAALSQGSCKATLNQVCAPCYNPVDGTATGACTTKPGDAPVEAAPSPFALCTGTSTASDPKLGTCVPRSLAAASGNSAVSSLGKEDCLNADDICAPTLKVKDLSACFVKCQVTNSTVLSLGTQYKDGACLPKFTVAEVQPAGASLLGQETCATGELCAPCLNPLSTPAGAPTGACE